jgi:hypothetical protein
MRRVGTFTERMIEEYGPMVAGVARQISQKSGTHVRQVLLPSIDKRSPSRSNLDDKTHKEKKVSGINVEARRSATNVRDTL